MVQYPVLKGFYEVEKTIGCGGFAKVKLATHIATGEKVAIKVMDKNKLGDDLPRVKLELTALTTLSHPHICKLYEVLETESHFFLVMEYCSGGELFDHIVEKNRLSETQSCTFFRQIVSAVVYLHSLGYAHRDLKPENVLLDGNQTIKLIDFGLCAKPEGGMKSPLSTSCGSPTYAAPELVMGRKYLGPEIDVWSLGVLLYALLCGFLPFDDQNIDGLYRKILKGKYLEPTFLSKESKDFIRCMLQVEPLNRIAPKDLLTHSWVTIRSILEPVKAIPEAVKKYDEDCVTLMAMYHNTTARGVWKNISRWKYDYNTSTYLLLCLKKSRGSPLKLYEANKIAITDRYMLKPINKELRAETLSPLAHKLIGRLKTENVTPKKDFDDLNMGNFAEPRKPSSVRKPTKRYRSPTLESEPSPVPAKKATPGKATPGKSTPKTPERKRTPGKSETPGSARRMLGSIERSLNRVRHVLTPRKITNDHVLHPATLANKDLCNVSTTQSSDPEFVINELSKALQNKGMLCERKGFSLRGKMEPDTGRRFGGCSFELEICYLPHLSPPIPQPSWNVKPIHGVLTPTGAKSSDISDNVSKTPQMLITPSALVGIRRKRLKGDSWCYKKVCEEVLALTATDFKQVIESCV